MDSISVTVNCPHCRHQMEIRLSGQHVPDGFHLNMGNHRCPGCGKDLILYASRADQQFLEFRLVDPARPWTFEEIMNQEG